MLISVIIPIYNTADYLERCIDSIINQTYKNLEIVLVDDGSTDGSGEICDKYASSDSRVCVLHKANGGLVSSRKAGLKLAKGEYISYIDSDDYLELNAYEELYNNYLQPYFPDFIDCFFYKEYSGVISVRKVNFKEGFYSKKQITESLEDLINVNPPFLYAIHSSLCSKIIKKSLLDIYQYKVDENLMLGEDFAVSFQLLINANTLCISHTPYYHYCVREKSMTYDTDSSKYDIYVDLNKFAISCLKDSEYIFHRYYFQRAFDLLLDYFTSVPDEYIKDKDYFPYFENVKRGSRVIVYCKGLYAKNIINVIKRNKFLNIIDNIDSVDAKGKLVEYAPDVYDNILIAMGDSKIACSIRDYLMELGIEQNKICMISNNFIHKDNLPYEIQKLYDDQFMKG